MKINACKSSVYLHFAEREGFEPTVRKAYNGFRDRPDRPLRHLSSLAIRIFSQSGCKVRAIFLNSKIFLQIFNQ